MLKDKKILMIATTDNMIWQFLIPHIRHLEKLGNTVECVCARTGFWFEDLEKNHNITMHEINFSRNPINPKNVKCYKQLKNLQKEKKFDVIYCQQPVGGVMGRLLAKKFKLPCIYTAHGFHFYKGCPLKNKIIYKTVEKYLSKYTDALITINDEDYEAAKKMQAKNVYKINGIGMDEKKNQLKEFNFEKFRRLLGIMPEDKVILTISEINKNKNYETMLKAIKICVEKDSNIKFIALGTGVLEQRIKNLSQELGIEQNCLFLGYRQDVWKFLHIADLFIHSSYREGLTLSVIEAMSFGLPCVVSNVRGNRDLIQNGVGGFVINPTDEKEFANKIIKIINDTKLAKNFGDYNKRESEKYKVENIKKQLEEVYKNL